jgi:hypothetical protein
MATGMYRNSDGFAPVDYDGNTIPISRSKYEANGYKPDFDKLPSEAEYLASQEQAKPAMPRGLREPLAPRR